MLFGTLPVPYNSQSPLRYFGGGGGKERGSLALLEENSKIQRNFKGKIGMEFKLNLFALFLGVIAKGAKKNLVLLSRL